MLVNKNDFTFESVLSTPRNYDLMERAKKNGYKIVCIYVLTTNAEINVQRVEARVKIGGHDVPAEKVRERYLRSMKLFPRLFSICDECYVYDNSLDRNDGEPSMIISLQYGEIKLMPNSEWTMEMLRALCSGTYDGKDYKKSV